ncbi:MAG: FAD-dependent oxidoreductase [Acidobacteria bacterium]|nr:FAD-dependent oxidoreductase [Acidobacteriota bacterium]
MSRETFESGETFDAVIVGAGTAGMPCAITAAQHGARVAVVEKTAEVGGSLHVSAGSMSAAGTRRQRERGIDDDPRLHLDDIIRITRGTANPALARLAVEEAPHAVDWLDELGYAFDEATPLIYSGYEPYSRARVYFGQDLARSIYVVLRPLWDEHVAAGRIVPFLETSLQSLLLDEQRVVGVTACRKTGELTLRSQAVVLATGGYGSNPELFSELTPGSPRLVSATRLSSTGDGLQIAREHGAAVRGTEHYLGTIGGIEEEPGSGRSDWWAGYANIYPSERPPAEIHVNGHGVRFVAEDHPSPDLRQRIQLEQPDGKLWVVFGAGALKAGEPLVPQWDAATFRRKAREGRCAFSASTLRELAGRAGIDADGLERTVRAWNEAVRTGVDPLGRREPGPPIDTPPYYALLTHPISLLTFAGLAVDTDLRVLSESGVPIEGLHAIGEVIGGSAVTGNAFCTGMMVTPALSFGRIVGRRLTVSV